MCIVLVALGLGFHRGPDFPSDPPFPSFVPGADQETEESQGDIWCPQVEEDPLEIKTDD